MGKVACVLVAFCLLSAYPGSSQSATGQPEQPRLSAASHQAEQPARPLATEEQSNHVRMHPGSIEVLSDTMGVDFGPYLQAVQKAVRQNWYSLIPEVARPPIMKQGNVAIEFAILKDGRVAEMKRVMTSGNISMDRGAWGAITSSNPFSPLPAEFHGQFLALRFYFKCGSSGYLIHSNRA